MKTFLVILLAVLFIAALLLLLDYLLAKSKLSAGKIVHRIRIPKDIGDYGQPEFTLYVELFAPWAMGKNISIDVEENFYATLLPYDRVTVTFDEGRTYGLIYNRKIISYEPLYDGQRRPQETS